MVKIKLWISHPFRMINLHYGFCPACSSSPPKDDCSVCLGTREYGRTRIGPGTKEEWLIRFRNWLKWRKDQRI
jgi:hypothetical protein